MCIMHDDGSVSIIEGVALSRARLSLLRTSSRCSITIGPSIRFSKGMCSDLRCDEWTTAASWTDQGLLQPESAHDFVRFEMPLPLADVALLNLDEIYMGGIGPRCRSISALIACGSRSFHE